MLESTWSQVNYILISHAAWAKQKGLLSQFKTILSFVQNGHPVSQNPENLRGVRQFISTFLFDQPQLREAMPIEVPLTSNQIQIRRSPLQLKESSPIKKVNIIVPISLGRVETIHRFLRIWNDLFKKDKNQRLILSFSGTDAEHRNDIAFLSVCNKKTREYRCKGHSQILLHQNCREIQWARSRSPIVVLPSIEHHVFNLV